MNKGKMLLSAIALFAVIGGTLAFKATRVTNTFFSYGPTLTTTTPGGPLVNTSFCTVPFQTTYTTAPDPLVFSKTTNWSTIASSTTSCLITVYQTI